MTELIESELPKPEWESVPSPVSEAPAEKRKPGRPKGSVSVAKQDVISGELETKLLEVFIPIGIASPLAYCVLEDRAARFSKALVRRSSRNPKLKAAIDTFLSGTDFVDIAMLPVGMVIAALVDYNRIGAESKPAHYFKIDEFWMQEYGQSTEEEQSTNGLVTVPERSAFIING